MLTPEKLGEHEAVIVLADTLKFLFSHEGFKSAKEPFGGIRIDIDVMTENSFNTSKFTEFVVNGAMYETRERFGDKIVRRISIRKNKGTAFDVGPDFSLQDGFRCARDDYHSNIVCLLASIKIERHHTHDDCS